MNTLPADLAAEPASDLATASAGFWLAIGVIALVLLIGSSLRVVPEYQRVVVSRLGRVVRVSGPGPTFRVPGVERLTTVTLRPVQLPLVVSATTRDGVPVRVAAAAVCRITDPALSTIASPDPLGATAAALESALGKEVAHIGLAGLLPGRAELESRIPQEVTRATATWGVDVVDLEVSGIETRLTSDLLHSVHRQTEAGDR